MAYHNQSKIKCSGFSGRHILVVDDDYQIQSVLSCVLCRFGCVASLANNGEEGMKKFRSKPYSLVFTDLEMPGMDGITFASSIKALSPLIPIVLMTGAGYKEVMARNPEDAVDHILFKPLNVTRILEVMERLLPQRVGLRNHSLQQPARDLK
jgi:DNA-binding NtrC family response regulator